jgi:hypothetical protein
MNMSRIRQHLEKSVALKPYILPRERVIQRESIVKCQYSRCRDFFGKTFFEPCLRAERPSLDGCSAESWDQYDTRFMLISSVSCFESSVTYSTSELSLLPLISLRLPRSVTALHPTFHPAGVKRSLIMSLSGLNCLGHYD